MLLDIWLSPNAWSSPCFQSSPHKARAHGTEAYAIGYDAKCNAVR
jgi:hypothetical protein